MRKNNQVLLNNQHAIAIFNYVTLLPLVYYIPPWLIHNLTDDHLYVTMISLTIIVPVISYITMPLFIRILGIFNNR